MEAGNAHTWPRACNHPQAGTGGGSEAECPSPGFVLLFCTGLRKAHGLKELIKELISKEKILNSVYLAKDEALLPGVQLIWEEASRMLQTGRYGTKAQQPLTHLQL